MDFNVYHISLVPDMDTITQNNIPFLIFTHGVYRKKDQ
jgi:hypothetical protein